MKLIENSIDEFVRKVKKDEALKNICFIKGYSSAPSYELTDDYLIAVSQLDSKVGTSFLGDYAGENLKGSMYDLTLKFRIFARKDVGGQGLVTLSNELTRAIKENDTASVCSDIKILPVAFCDDAMCVYRDVHVQMSFCVCEEVVR
ncbi:MAG: hypothetical protein IIX27_01950 [Ruminococcus sp.]|nr:hypothetical protein [Ruminococcus sp.]